MAFRAPMAAGTPRRGSLQHPLRTWKPLVSPLLDRSANAPQFLATTRNALRHWLPAAQVANLTTAWGWFRIHPLETFALLSKPP